MSEARYVTKGIPRALVLFLTDLEDEATDGGSWGSDEQEAAWLVARRLFALPVEQRMEAMGMIEGECRWCGIDPTVAADVTGECIDGDDGHLFMWREASA